MNVVLKSIAKLFQSNSKKIYVLVKYEHGGEKRYFQYKKDGVDCFSMHRAGAWYFDSPSKAREARDYLGLKNDLCIESFERV